MSETEKKEMEWSHDCFQIATNVMFTQMSAKKGIKMFKERDVAAMLKEYTQLDDMNTVGPLDPDKLTPEQKRKALPAVNLIKEKRNGIIKGRTCADGSPQRGYIPREKATSATLSLDALLVSLVIDAMEGRDVAIFDVPGAYLWVDMPEEKEAILKSEGDFIDIMCDVNPEHIPNIRYENGKKVLCLRILKALYGCIESALLWYEIFANTLKDMGFEINPYEKCVGNKMINGKQCTICWYVDDNKLSHVYPAVNTMIIDAISEHFGKLVVTRGNKHTFLGMDLEMLDGRRYEELSRESHRTVWQGRQ